MTSFNDLRPFIFSSDRGGSEALIGFLQFYNIPARGVLLDQGKIVADELNYKLTRTVRTINSFLYTTGFENNRTFKLLTKFKNENIPTYCFLDSPQNLSIRFLENGSTYFPDYIFVHDKEIKDNLNSINYKGRILNCENYYIRYLRKNFRNIKSKKKTAIILSDPFDTEDYKSNSFNEKELEVFNKLFEHLRKLNYDHIVFRLHPSDNIRKFNSIPFKKYVELDKSSSIAHALQDVTLAVGHSTHALKIAEQLGICCSSFKQILSFE